LANFKLPQIKMRKRFPMSLEKVKLAKNENNQRGGQDR
jgi:hypothetical protein